MSMYAITRRTDGTGFAIVGAGQRFKFPPEDGPLLADLLESEFPECQACEDRGDTCQACGLCEFCGCDHERPDDGDDEDDEDGDTE